MNRLASVFVILLSGTVSLLPFGSGARPSRPPDPDGPGSELVWEGIRAFYNYEFDHAVSVLSSARIQYPEHPAVHFSWAVSRWLRARQVDGFQESYVELETSLGEIIPVYENLVRHHPGDPRYALFLGSSKGLMARVHLGKKEWLGVLFQGVKGYRLITDVRGSHPEIKDAYLPIGLLNFYAGNSSAVVRFLAGLLGIQADTELGLRQIEVAAREGEYAWVEANRILAFITLWVRDDYDAALEIATKLRDHFPASIYTQHLVTESLIRLGRFDEAEENLRLTRDMLEDLPPFSRKGWEPTLLYQEALLRFSQGNLEAALSLVTDSIDKFAAELDTPLGFGYLLRGNIHDLRGERELAVADYRSALSLNNHTSAMEKAKQYLEEPFSRAEM
ncbi:MAG: tetratricopeptide repeat protein [Fidelibacterota bacterium]